MTPYFSDLAAEYADAPVATTMTTMDTDVIMPKPGDKVENTTYNGTRYLGAGPERF